MGIEALEGWGERGEVHTQRDYRTPFLRVAPGEYVHIIVTCHMPWRYPGHWGVGGIDPCGGDECEFCRQGIGAQMRYVFDVYHATERRELVWETGESLALCVRALANGAASIRGLPLELHKASASERSRTICAPWAEGNMELMRLFPVDVDLNPEIPHSIDSRRILREWWAWRGAGRGAGQSGALRTEFSTGTSG